MESVDMGELIHQAEVEIAHFLQIRKQTLELSLVENMPPVMMDRSKIHDVLINLLTNAIKFTPDGGSIRIITKLRNAQMMECQVADNGIGIREEDKPHIFEQLFSSLDSIHHASGLYEFNRRGIGLGLALVRKFVGMHQGQVEFESEFGKGSRFIFTLPLNLSHLKSEDVS